MGLWAHLRNHMLYARHQIRAALTQPSSRNCNVHIHADAFNLSSIHATLSSHCTSHQHPFILTLPRRCNDAAAPGRRYAKEAKEIEKQCGSALRFETLAVTYATLWLQPNKMPGHDVLCGAARRARSLRCSKCVFSFCTKFFPRSLTRGKNPVCPEPGQNLVAGTRPLGRSGPERAGRAGQGWLAGPGWGWGRAGPRGGGVGDVRVPTKKCA